MRLSLIACEIPRLDCRHWIKFYDCFTGRGTRVLYKFSTMLFNMGEIQVMTGWRMLKFNGALLIACVRVYIFGLSLAFIIKLKTKVIEHISNFKILLYSYVLQFNIKKYHEFVLHHKHVLTKSPAQYRIRNRNNKFTD